MKKNIVRLSYCPGETGWGSIVSKDPLHVRIDNIPYSGKLNYHDVVAVTTNEDGWLFAGKRISRKYKRRTAIYYDTIPQFKKLSSEFRKLGA